MEDWRKHLPLQETFQSAREVLGSHHPFHPPLRDCRRCSEEHDRDKVQEANRNQTGPRFNLDLGATKSMFLQITNRYIQKNINKVTYKTIACYI